LITPKPIPITIPTIIIIMTYFVPIVIALICDGNTHIKQEIMVNIVSKVIVKSSQLFKPTKYPYHTCGIIGHKMVDFPKFSEMQNMFKDKNTKPIEKSTYN
jgi:hypothetical protein